ncbi:ribonuclease E/G [bacterium]|nr:ribonuclease E/G [bacterium]
MASPDTSLMPGDIVRGIVDHVDSSLDACFLDAGPYGTLFIPLAGLNGTTVARMVPNARVCVQIVAPQRGKKLPRASASIEFSGRTSVLILDGAALTGKKTPASVEVFVSRKVPAVKRAELATKLQNAVSDPATGLPSMLATAVGPMTIILRTLAAEVPWEQVLSAAVVQLTEAAAFTVLARAGSEPALLMSEKTDADGDSSIVARRYGTPEDMLDGRRIALANGGEVVFERTEAMWTVDVNTAHAHATDKAALIEQVNTEAARAIGESILEYDVGGLIAIDFVSGLPKAKFDALREALQAALGTSGVHISGDVEIGVMLVARRATKRG